MADEPRTFETGAEDAPSLLLPIAGPDEVEAFLRRLPMAVDRPRFTALVLGFPRRYLATTPAVEVVRHYGLLSSLGSRPVISSLSRDGDRWRICVVARDRRYLFARIAGALSSHGLHIETAEAFANANSQVLDVFRCGDPAGQFENPDRRREFQTFLEAVVAGATDLDVRLRETHPELEQPAVAEFDLAWDDEGHPAATRLVVSGRDGFGLLYRLSRTISDAGCNIEVAYIATPGGAVHDVFFLTRDGGKLDAAVKSRLETALSGHRPPKAEARARA
jgi:[protein-PII] uridylyltransferase